MYVLAVPNPNFEASQEVQKEPEYFLRPKAREFVAAVSEKWEIVLYSSRKSDQLASLVNALDPLRCYIKFVLDRRHCYITQHKKCVKDLSLVQGLDLDSAIIVDYKPQNVAFCIDSSLIVMHWNGSENDSELMPGLLDQLNSFCINPHPAKLNRQVSNYSDFLSQIYKRF